jgi:hypothetical protein
MRVVLPWTTDDSGIVVGCRTHDATVQALELRKGLLRLTLKTIAGRTTILEFREVVQLAVQELWEASIVSYVFCWKIENSPDYALDIPDGAWPILLRDRGPVDRKSMCETMARFSSHLVAQILCSYGGNIALICKNMVCFEDDESERSG